MTSTSAKWWTTRKPLTLGSTLLLVTVAGAYYYFSCYFSARSPEAHGLSLQQTLSTIVAFQDISDDQPHCDPLPHLDVEGEVKRWHRVDSGSEWYVYSAYVDHRPSFPIVRIVAMSKGDSAGPLYCRWWWQDAGNSPPVRVQKQELWIRAWDSAEPGRYYHPFLLSCPVPRSRCDPTAVSVVREACGRPQHRIRLVPSEKDSSGGRFVVCLKPLEFEEDISLRLLEWLELQYILGADSVYAYIYKLHPRTWEVLRHYEALGKVRWQNHTLPTGTAGLRTPQLLWQKRRHEMAVYNDCFYRHIHSHLFVVNLDLDEAIVPVIRDSWPELLADNSRSAAASLSVRNVYFFDSFGEVDDPAVPEHMHMLRHVVRSANFTPPGFAQKSFFLTRFTEVVSNHFALRAVRPDVKILVGMDVGSVHLHHYRKGCPPVMERDCETNYMRFRERDTLLWKFKDRLIRNVVQTMQELRLDGVLHSLSKNQTRVEE